MKVLTRALTAVSLAGVVAITAAPAASAVIIYNKRYTSERLCHSNARQIALQGATILVNCRYEGATHGSTPMWLLSYHY
jgi:hypothetical protein